MSSQGQFIAWPHTVCAKGRMGGMCAGARGSRSYFHQDVNFLMDVTMKQEPKLLLRQGSHCHKGLCFHCRSGLSLDFSTQKQLISCPIQLSFRAKSWVWAKWEMYQILLAWVHMYFRFNFQVSISFISPRGNIVIYIPSYSILGVFCSLWAMKAAKFYDSRTCTEGILWSQGCDGCGPLG